MNVLLLNQAFYPDVVATAQQLTDLAEALAARGHRVTVVAGDHGYDDPSKRFASREEHRGVRIIRIGYGKFGKGSKAARAADFASFHARLGFTLLGLSRQDVTVALTSPPLISVTAKLFQKVKGGRFVYWVMDLNPDEAVAARWLGERSLTTRVLRGLNGWSLRGADRIVALDRFMAERIIGRYGVRPAAVTVLPPWAHDDRLEPVPHERNPFRREHGLEEKFVVMYSGNHSPCHPLETLLEAARRLREDRQVLFCFIGGGSLVARVREFARENGLANILQLPYQPIETLSFSLSAADLHVAVMGEPFVGILHPCKLYGVLSVGRPFVFIGPRASHLGELVRDSGLGCQVAHGDVPGLLAAIADARAFDPARLEEILRRSRAYMEEGLSRDRLCGRLVTLLEKTAQHSLETARPALT